MNLVRLSNRELDSKIKTLAQREREVLHEVLVHIYEADRRRLYLDLAYSSLFTYLTEGCRYSSAAAQRRIDAARLMISVPEVAEKIKSGEISLSQVGALQKAIREKNKIEKVSTDKKKDLVKKISSKSMSETQGIIAQDLDLKIKKNQKATQQKDGSVRLELTFTNEEWEELLHARELLSNAVNSNEWSQVFSYLAKKVIQKKSGQVQKSSESTPTKSAITSAAEVKSSPTDAVLSTMKRKILIRDRVCQYKNNTSGKICGSRWNLEIDHLQPRWANGGNEEGNLRVLCRKHNQHVYKKQAGISRPFMSAFETSGVFHFDKKHASSRQNP